MFAQLVRVSELTPEILFGLRAVTGIIPRVEPGNAKAILFGESKLDEQNYPEFQSVLRERHLLTAAEEEQDYNPSNAKAAALIARSKEINERLKKQKQAEDGDLTILDLISILAVQSKQSTEKIGEYDMYQLLDQ